MKIKKMNKKTIIGLGATISGISLLTLVGTGLGTLFTNNKNIDNDNNNFEETYALPSTDGSVSIGNQFRTSTIIPDKGWIGLVDDQTISFTSYDQVRRATWSVPKVNDSTVIADVKFSAVSQRLIILSVTKMETLTNGSNRYEQTIYSVDFSPETPSNVLKEEKKNSVEMDANYETRKNPNAKSIWTLKHLEVVGATSEDSFVTTINPLAINYAILIKDFVRMFQANDGGKNTFTKFFKINNAGVFTQDNDLALGMETAFNTIQTRAESLGIYPSGVIPSHDYQIKSDLVFMKEGTSNIRFALAASQDPLEQAGLLGSMVFYSMLLSNPNACAHTKLKSLQGNKTYGKIFSPSRQREEMNISGIGYSRSLIRENGQNDTYIPIKLFDPEASTPSPIPIVFFRYLAENEVRLSWQPFIDFNTIPTDEEYPTNFSQNFLDGQKYHGEILLDPAAGALKLGVAKNQQMHYGNLQQVTWVKATRNFNRLNFQNNAQPFLVTPNAGQIGGFDIWQQTLEAGKQFLIGDGITQTAKIVSFGDYQTFANESPGFLDKGSYDVTQQDLIDIVVKNNLGNTGANSFGGLYEGGQKIVIRIIEVQPTTLKFEIKWETQVLGGTHPQYFAYFETVTLTGFKATYNVPFRSFSLFSINNISGSTKDINLTVGIKTAAADIGALRNYELRFGYKDRRNNPISLGDATTYPDSFYPVDRFIELSTTGFTNITVYDDMNLYVKMAPKEGVNVPTEAIYDRQEYLLINKDFTNIQSEVPSQTGIPNVANFKTFYFTPGGTEAENNYSLKYYASIPMDWTRVWGFSVRRRRSDVIFTANSSFDLASLLSKGVEVYYVMQGGVNTTVINNNEMVIPRSHHGGSRVISFGIRAIAGQNPQTSVVFEPPLTWTNMTVQDEIIIDLVGSIAPASIMVTSIKGTTADLGVITPTYFVDFPQVSRDLLGFQFRLGNSTSPVVDWLKYEDFKARLIEIATGNSDVSGADTILSVRLGLKNPDTPLGDSVSGQRYTWDRTEVELFSHARGLNPQAIYDVYGDPTGHLSYFRTWVSVNENYYETFEVKTNIDGSFNLEDKSGAFNPEDWATKGIELVYGDSLTNIDQVITSFSQTLTSTTNKIYVKLRAKQHYTIADRTVAWWKGKQETTPQLINLVKTQITDLNPNNFLTNIVFTGTTNNLTININDSLWRSVAFENNVDIAKQYIDIRFRTSNDVLIEDALSMQEFITYLSTKRDDELNALNPSDFVVNYFLKTAGQSLFSGSMFINSPDYDITSGEKGDTSAVVKSIDLTRFVNLISNITTSGTTSAITFGGLIPSADVEALGFKMEWSYWEYAPGTLNIVRSPWVTNPPTKVDSLINPDNPSEFYPIAIRLVKINPDAKIDGINFTSGTAQPLDETKGYEVDTSALTEVVELTEQLGPNYKAQGVDGNVVSMNVGVRETSVSPIAKKMLKVQFAIGSTETNLIINWTDVDDFKTTIATYNETRDILKLDLNIYMKLVLVGTPDNPANPDIIDGKKYVYDKTIAQVYNNITGINATYSADPIENKLRAYSRVQATWANSLSAEGIKASEVKILDKTGAFDLKHYQDRGIKLEVSPDGTTWTTIQAFNANSIDASATNKMRFRLSVIDPVLYEIYGAEGVIEPGTTPPGTTSVVITKDIIAKKLLPGILANDLTSTQLQVTGSTHSLNIIEDDTLYTNSGLSLTVAKTFFEIKYSFDGTTYFAKEEFIRQMTLLSGTTLNNLDFVNFRVRYEFTLLGSETYYSTQVFGDENAAPADVIKQLNMSQVMKTIDLHQFTLDVATITLTGTTNNIIYANELDTITLNSWGVKIEWSYWTTDVDGNIVRSPWSIDKPTTVATIKNPNPADTDNFPIAIRFMKIDTTNNIDLQDIINGVANTMNDTKGYEVDVINLTSMVEINDILGVNYKIGGLAGNVVNMTTISQLIDVSGIAKKHLELQFAIGSNINTLVVDWSNQANFKTNIATYNETNDILITQLNIYMKLVLIGGTGTNNDIIDGTRYVWDTTIAEVYNNATGVNGTYSTDPNGSKLRAYSRIQATWANSLSAEGNKSTAVKIINIGGAFDLKYYQDRGIKLEVSPDGTTWTTITAFNTDTFNASLTNKMNFRLSIIDDTSYEMYGASGVIEPDTIPSGITSVVISKDIVAKKLLTGLLANDLTSTKLQVTGSTHSLIVSEGDALYTSSGLTVDEAKTFFEIKYSFDGTNYFAKEEFIRQMTLLSGSTLNNLNFTNFRVRYEFTALGNSTYYSPEVFGDPDATDANVIKELNMNVVVRTIDLHQFILDVAQVSLTGSTLNIVYANELDATTLNSLGVKIEWSYWMTNVDGNIVRSPWSINKPTAVATIKNPNPEDTENFPIAIRLVKIDPGNSLIELKDIVENVANPMNDTKGYEVDVINLTSIVEINDQLGTNYKLNGFTGNVVSMTTTPEFITVSGLAQKHLELQFAIGSDANTLVVDWSNQANFKTNIATYNETKDILKTELNIYMKLVLIGGTGTDNDVIDGTRYVWDKTIAEVYNNSTGVNGTYSSDTAGNKLRAYSRIQATWANSLSAEGNKSTAVKIINIGGEFNLAYYEARGIKLEVSPNGTTWTTITDFNTDTFDASLTNKMNFRLSVIDPTSYEMYGASGVIEPDTIPSGITSVVISKDIVAKKLLTGVLANDLTSTKLQVTGSTHSLQILEDDALYTSSGLTAAEAKTFFEIKYSFDGTTYFAKEEFIRQMALLSGATLNNLNFTNFRVRYEFTALGNSTYYSPEVFGDPDATDENVIKELNMNVVVRTIDLHQFILDVAQVSLTGSTANIVYANELDATTLNSLGVKIEWSYWMTNVDGNIVRSPWSTDKPTTVATIKNPNPEDVDNFPIAIRLVKIDPTNSLIELKDIVENVANPMNDAKGYEVNVSNLTSIVEINDQLGTNYKLNGFTGNVVSMTTTPEFITVSGLAQKHLELQFAIGSDANTLVVNWSNQANFKTNIATYNETKDILKTELNIYMKLILIGGTGTDNDIIDGTRYVWDKTIAEVYNNSTGVNGTYSSDTAGNKLRAYSRIQATWADSLSAEGNKSTAVKIIETGGLFDLAYYEARGIKLEVSPNGTTWTTITAFNTDTFDASETNKMNFRLSVIDPTLYEMYGANGVIETTTPPGTTSVVINKDIKAKIELPGVIANDLTSNKLQVTGSTHSLQILEDDTLYTVSGMTVAEAKTFFEIKYSTDGITYSNKATFIAALSSAKGSALNNLDLTNFKVRYEFTSLGLEKYWSTEVFGSPDALASNVIKPLDTSQVFKTIDVNKEINDIQLIVLTGSTESLKWPDTPSLDAIANYVKLEYGRYVNTAGVISYEWSDVRPTSIYSKDIPEGHTNYPLGIRFVPKLPTDKVEIGTITGPSNVFEPSNTTLGYEVDTQNIKTIINIDTTTLGTKIIFTGYLDDLNPGETNAQIEESAMELVDPIFRDKVGLLYQISTSPTEWVDLNALKAEIIRYSKDFANSTSGVIIFDNGKIPGVTISAQFISLNPEYDINATPEPIQKLNTDQIKTKIDLREYVKVLLVEKVIPTGSSSGVVGKLTIPGMTEGNVIFGGWTFELIERFLAPIIDIQFKAPGFHGENWVALDQITAVNNKNELFIRFAMKIDAEPNIELSLVNNNDYAEHMANGFKLKLALPIEIPTNPNNLISAINLSGDTKNIVINDQKVYDDLIALDPIYTGKVQVLYSIGKDPIALDPNKPTKFEFNKVDFIDLLSKYSIDILLANKQISARYALADGISEDDFTIQNQTFAALNSSSLKIFIHKSNYSELARVLKVSGPSTAVKWGFELDVLESALSEGLYLQYSTDNTALAEDPVDSAKWVTTPPTSIDPNSKFLAVRFVVKEGFVFEDKIELFLVNTANVLAVIELQSIWLEQINLIGNTKNINFDLTRFNKVLSDNNTPGVAEIIIQYSFGGTPNVPGIDPYQEWYTAEQIQEIFSGLKGAKDKDELILLRNSLKARYSLSDAGFAEYRFKIDGTEYYEPTDQSPNVFKDLVNSATSLNDGFEGYINLDLINTFIGDSFQIRGSNENPILNVSNNHLIKALGYYTNQSNSPFDILYTNVKGDYTNPNWKLFGETGFITTFAPDFKILTIGTDVQPIYFKLVPRTGYKVYQNNVEIVGGEEITIIDIKVMLEVVNPLTVAPEIRFLDSEGARFYQGSGSLTVYDTISKALVDSAFLNAAHPDNLPLKLEYNISDILYTPEEKELVVNDPTKWGVLPKDLIVGKYVMVRVALNNDKYMLIGGDAMTEQVRVKGLLVRAENLKLDTNLALENTDNYGYSPIDGRTAIGEAKFVPDTDNSMNFLGADMYLSIESEFYKDALGNILLDSNNIPIIKRNTTGATTIENYKDASGQEILDADGNPIPIWTIEKDGVIIPAKPSRTGKWQQQKMDELGLGTFVQQNTDNNYQWKLFQSQFIRITFVPKIGIDGTSADPDFYFDETIPEKPEIELTGIRYPIQMNGIEYQFDQSQALKIKYVPDDESATETFSGESHISNIITATVTKDGIQTELKGDAIEKQLAIDSNGLLKVSMTHTRKGSPAVTQDGVNVSIFKGLKNGDIITINFTATTPDFILSKPIEPLRILVSGLFVRPPSDELFKYLRPNFSGTINGGGQFNIRVSNPNDPFSTNEKVLGDSQWYEYQVWNSKKTIKVPWTKDEEKISSLENGDKVEWKIVDRDGVLQEDFYNTLLGDATNPFKVTNVVNGIETTWRWGKGNSSLDNPNVNGIPQYPKNSGWLVSGLKTEIVLDEIQKSAFEKKLQEFNPTFNGINGLGTMISNIENDPSISQEVQIQWQVLQRDGVQRVITDFKKANLSNGDKVWATLAPSSSAMENNEVLDPSNIINSQIFVVNGLTEAANSASQTLLISLITASSILLVGITGLVIFLKRNSKIKVDKMFKNK